MKQEQLDRFRGWFGKYVKGYYGTDDFVNANIKLKEIHSQRVCDEMRYLTDELNLSENQKRIADAIALFHDVGRFEQFKLYRTYSDVRSINHSALSVEILNKQNVLDGVDEQEKEFIEKAIQYHGIKEIPAGVNGDLLLFSKLIRDADKIDIFRVATEYYRQYQENPKGFRLEVELPDEPTCSQKIIEAILNGQKINYKDLRTWNDMKLLQLGWVYDMNFTATLKRIKQRRYLEQMASFLPQTADIEKVLKKVLEYVDARISEEQH